MSDDRRTVFLDDTTVASNPGRARVSFWRWAVYHPHWPVALGAPLVWLTYLVFTSSLWWAIAALPLVGINFLYWRLVTEHMAHGNVCPGVVVCEHPLRVAVFTDMTKGSGSFPVLKIIEVPYYVRWDQRPEADDRVVTVALYQEHAEEGCLPYWKNFRPIVAAPVVRAKSDLIQLEASLDSEYCDNVLQNALRAVSSREPGLHRVRNEDSDWEDEVL